MPPEVSVAVCVASGIVGLRPVVSVSVEPSGIAPPISELEFAIDIGAEEEAALADDDVQPDALVIPPPSNVEVPIMGVVPL
jgi:hypothetical protein